MYKTLNLVKKGNVYTLTLNDPATRNALSHRMAEEFETAVREVAQDPQSRFLILTGSGPSFCSGGDFNSVIRDLEDQPLERKTTIYRFYGRFLSLRDLHVPTLAAVNGHAIGAGFCLALACDMRIASSNATFSMSFVRLGLHPGMGATFFLPRAVGTARAFEIFMTGSTISAQEALSMGLLNQVVKPDELGPCAMELAERIASFSPLAVQYIKRSIYLGMKVDLWEAMRYEAYAQAMCSETPAFRESVQAFRKKRHPRGSSSD